MSLTAEYPDAYIRKSDSAVIHEMDNCAPIYGKAGTPAMGNASKASDRTPTAMTGKQKLVLMLKRAGYSNREIGDKMGIKHEPQVCRLVHRAEVAEKAQLRMVLDFISAA